MTLPKRSAIAQIIPNKLYFASYEQPPREDTQDTVYLCLDDYVHYDAFYDDFGPYNLAVLYRFCEVLTTVIKESTDKNIFVVTDFCPRNRVNGAYLLAAYMIIFHKLTADQAYLRVQAVEPPLLIGFRDAAMGESTHSLHVQHVIKSIEKAIQLKWLDFEKFDPDEYEFYERVENGDFNWIVPEKILSFCGPHDQSYLENGYPYHAPELYFKYFKTHNVTTIVRLNKKIYDAKRFVNAGFEHFDLFFIDGSTPNDEIVLKFIDIVDQAPGAVAIHCKAGLGRTGTLIACWMMKKYKLTAPQCMSWLRICRPGSVIGPQQQFLIDKQAWCWKLGGASKLQAAVNGKTSAILNSELSTKPKTTKIEETARPRLSSGKSKALVTRLANELDDFGLADLKNKEDLQTIDTTNVPTTPTKYPLRSRISETQLNGAKKANTLIVNDETVIDDEGRSQGDRLCEMKAKAQHSHLTKAKLSATPPRHQQTESNKPFTNMQNYAQTPSLHNSPSQFSSATTPIKQLRLSTSRCGLGTPTTSTISPTRIFSTRPTGYRNYSMNKIPISKVTVSTLYNRPSILRNNQNKKFMALFRSRNKPYSTSIRTLDFNALVNTNNSTSPTTHNYNVSPSGGKNTYELRPRRNIHLPSRFDPALNLLANNSALISRSPISATKSSSNI